MKVFGRNGLIMSNGGTLVTDKYGLTTGTVVYRLPVGRVELQPAFGSSHPYAAFCGLERRELRFTPGFWTLVCDYAGAEQDESDPEYELEIGTGREPIETHPDFVTKIGGKPSAPKNGAVFVDDTGHPTSDDKIGIFDRFRMTLESGERNLMAGVTGYEAANLTTWVKSWTSRSRPSDGGNVGLIDNPEGNPPNYGSGRNWRYMGLSSLKRGKAHANRKAWQLSGPGGWNEMIYGS